VVAASGNENAAVDFPAASKGAISVGSIDPTTGLRSTFSNFGSNLSLVAPGEDVLLYSRSGTLQIGTGTSFSSPIVSASVGLLRSLLPKATPAQITSAVLSSCRDLGPAGYDSSYGNGELDVWAAYRALMSQFPTQPSPSVSVSGTTGFTTTLTWQPLPGSDVVYHYGLAGGPTYSTTATSAQLWVGADGAYTARVSASASDMFSSAPATLGFTVATGHPNLTLQRFQGTDRYGTAAAVSSAEFPSGAGTVVVASGENFPDALSASVLAKRYGGPLLLAHRTSLPQATSDEIRRLRPSRIVMVGGTPAMSADVRAALTVLVPNVTRIFGADRYQTAEQVALAVRSLEGTSATSTVVLASGENFPDALSASPMAAEAGYPILLTRAGSLPSATSRAFGELGATRTLVIGGAPAVSDAVAAAAPSPTRIAGPDRYATSRALADYATSAGILGRGDLGVATGSTFPDALSGGVLMAQLGGPMVLADTQTSAFDGWLVGVGDECTRVDVFGSDAAVPAPLASHVLTALRGL
jgi:putative cell wall-binding protein